MADFDFDISGTKKLYEWCEEFNDKFDDFLDDFTKEAGLRLWELTRKATPVGKYRNDVLFYARKSVKEPNALKIVELDGAGEGMTGGSLRNSWTIKPLTKTATERTIEVFADATIAPYAVYVEHGHMSVWFNTKGKRQNRWIKGRHMASKSLKKVDKSIPSVFNQKFSQFIRELGLTDA